MKLFKHTAPSATGRVGDTKIRRINTVKRVDFDLFKSNAQHDLKSLGDMEFINAVDDESVINRLYDNGWYPECLYVLAMVDFLCRIHNVEKNPQYDKFRSMHSSEPVFPKGVLIMTRIFDEDAIKKQAIEECIPEFKRFNIIEKSIRDVI